MWILAGSSLLIKTARKSSAPGAVLACVGPPEGGRTCSRRRLPAQPSTGGGASSLPHAHRVPRSADDLEVEAGLLEHTDQPHPNGKQHLGASRGGYVAQVDDVNPAKAPEQRTHLGLGLSIVSTHEHGVVSCG